jgi:serine/threonine-protein kinase
MDDTLRRVRGALADRYTVEQELGRGGMAVVYLAQDRRHDRRVALKVLRPDGAGSSGGERFLREIRTAAQLHHPHILTLHDSGAVGDLLYYVMPYVEGETLRHRLERQGVLPIADAIRITREVADALDYANGRGIVHRDIKPENIFLSAGHALVGDFGIARAADVAGFTTSSVSSLTDAGVAIGTAAYMSPEQAMADPRIDGRSDQYSLGCVLYEMLAGQPPFTGPTARAIMARHTSDQVPPIVTVRPVPADMETAVVRALAKVPADRWPNATAFAEAVDTALATHVTQSREAVTVRRRLLRSSLLGGALLTFAAVGWFTWQSRSAGAADVVDSVAVLPFENLVRDSTRAAVIEALHAGLIGVLSREQALTVKGSQSVSRYRNSIKTVSEIGRELEVKALVTAQVYSLGDSLTLQLQLNQVVPEEHILWSGDYSADLGNALSLLEAAARDVANYLDISRAHERGTRPAREKRFPAAAYEAYAEGLYFWNHFQASRIDDAIAAFQRALDIAPDFALARAGLAQAYSMQPYYASVPPRVALPKAREAANMALSLDPEVAEAHSVLGWVWAVVDRDWERAGYHFRKAIEINPGYAVGHMWYAWYLAWVGRLEDAIESDLRARSIDPLSRRIISHQGIIYFMNRQYDKAIEKYTETLRLYPDFTRAKWDLGSAYTQIGELEKAIPLLTEVWKADSGAAGSATNPGLLGEAFARAGRADEAIRIANQLKAMRANGYSPPLNIGRIYMLLGDLDEAFRWFDLADQERDGDMVLLNIAPVYDPVRADPRFQDLVRRMRFPSRKPS